MEATKKQFVDVMVKYHCDITPSTPEPGLTRWVGAFNEKLFLAEHRMVKGWVGSEHAHPHDQVVFVISGHLRFVVQGKTYELSTGDTLTVGGGVKHQASALEDSHVIDVFTPCREDYI